MGIKWNEDLALGVPLIDDQHKELISRVDKLLLACKEGQGNDEVARLLDFLDTYVITHFRDEEKLQQENGFPDYETHKREHATFIANIADLKKRMKAEGNIQLEHVLNANNLLLDWLLRHIAIQDRALGEHLKAKGLV
jgi:hemerythrin